jgi:hypothetical protein
MTNTAARETEEAVLDSIRRLLSDGQPHPRGHEAPPQSGNEKLLLTPALRVEEPPAVPRAKSVPVSWSLEERIAELEAAVGERADDWEPDGSEDADQERPSRFLFQHRPVSVGTQMAEPQPAEYAARPGPDRVARTEQDEDEDDDEDEDESDGFDIFEDDRLPDPDALRDLVAEIVRQELQSDLGQRVTRNIRKLVRREIRRALAARDFD